jgi:hypothetical protein
MKGEALPTSGMASARLKGLTLLREGRKAAAARSDGLWLAAADPLQLPCMATIPRHEGRTQ